MTLKSKGVNKKFAADSKSPKFDVSSSSDADSEQNQQQQQNSFQANTPPRLEGDVSNSSEILLALLLQALQRLWQQIKQASSFILNELGGYQALDNIAQWCIRNPNKSLCLLAAGLVMFLPFLVILGFGISTFVLTFTGILFLEGTLLTFVCALLFGSLVALAFALVILAIFAVAAYFGVVHVYGLYGGMERHKTAVLNFLQTERARLMQSAQQPNSGNDLH